MARTLVRGALVGFGTLLLVGGCPGNITIDLPGDSTITIPLSVPGDVVRVEVLNDTDYDVNPRIRFDDATGFWESLVSATEELATGTLEPGDLITLDMGCDRVGIIYSEDAGQYDGPFTLEQAGRTRTLQREEDFDCGDVIQFQFIGNGSDFGVIVSVNNRVVD